VKERGLYLQAAGVLHKVEQNAV